MAYAEKRGSGTSAYYIARFSDGCGKWPTVKDGSGATLRFRKKVAAERAGADEEANVRANRWKDPTAGTELLGGYANRWYAGLELAPSTMQNIKHHLEEHILPEFEKRELADILRADIDAWERKERAAGYKPSSIKTWRGTLHTLLADAVEEGLIPANPAAKRRGRGRRAGRKRDRGPEKVITDSLGALLVAERAAILSGRADELVLLLLTYFTGARWAEMTGLEVEFAPPRRATLRIEYQLWEDDRGLFHRLPPKEDSYRDLDLPGFLAELVAAHVARTAPEPCECHGRTYVFRGRSAAPTGAARISDVAQAAKVSVGTVSNVLNRPDRVADKTRTHVEEVIADLDFDPQAPARPGVHWRRSGFSEWVFEPAASGWYPKRAAATRRPVPLLAEPWPGRPVRGRGSQARAELNWLPVAAGLTPHGLRHAHKSLMAQLRVPEVLSHERLGHELDGIGGRYSHVTPLMRKELMEHLTDEWEASLDARAALHPRSPVAVLDELLQARNEKKSGTIPQDRPTEFPQNGGVSLHSRPRKRV